MGFGNGYDSGYSDAIDDVRNGKVPGIGPASGDGGATPAFDAGVLEGYNVEKLLSSTDLSTYLDSLSDAQLKGLVSENTTDQLVSDWDVIRGMIHNNISANEGSGPSKLGAIITAVLDEANSRGLIIEPI